MTPFEFDTVDLPYTPAPPVLPDVCMPDTVPCNEPAGPRTSSGAAGAVVPIPTLPIEYEIFAPLVTHGAAANNAFGVAVIGWRGVNVAYATAPPAGRTAI